jgi:hypothetical protein
MVEQAARAARLEALLEVQSTLGERRLLAKPQTYHTGQNGTYLAFLLLPAAEAGHCGPLVRVAGKPYLTGTSSGVRVEDV